MNILQAKMMATDFWEQIKEIIIQLLESVIKAIVFVALFFEDARFILTGVIILVAIDQITGVWKALSLKQFQWKKFNRFYTKLILYLLVLMATYVYEKYVIELDSRPFTKGLAIIIGFQELSSSYLNIAAITGKSYIKEYVGTLKSKLNL